MAKKEERTVGQLINNTSRLVDNMVLREDTYYDTFINTEPKDVDVERVNPQGEEETIQIPNVAKLKNQFEEWRETIEGSGGQRVKIIGHALVIRMTEPNDEEQELPE